MLKRTADEIALWLSIKKTIKENEIDIYSYGIYCLFMKYIPLIIIGTISIALGKTFDAIVICSTFLLIRKYSGGYHAQTPARCLCMSVISIMCLIFLSEEYLYINNYLLVIIFLILFFLIEVKSPLLNSQKNYYRFSRKQIKIKLSIILIGIATLFIGMMICENKRVCFEIDLAMALVTVMLYYHNNI